MNEQERQERITEIKRHVERLKTSNKYAEGTIGRRWEETEIERFEFLLAEIEPLIEGQKTFLFGEDT